jgi:hypothetical protein
LISAHYQAWNPRYSRSSGRRHNSETELNKFPGLPDRFGQPDPGSEIIKNASVVDHKKVSNPVIFVRRPSNARTQAIVNINGFGENSCRRTLAGSKEFASPSRIPGRSLLNLS